MKSNGSARALLPSSGRTAVASSPLSSSPAVSSRMSPSGGKKRRSVNEKLPAQGGHAAALSNGSGISTGRMISPPHEGFPYSVDGMVANPGGMVMPSHDFLYQLQSLQQQQMHQQGMAVAAAATACGYPNGGIQAMPAGFPSQYMIPRAPSSNAMMNAHAMAEDSSSRSFGSATNNTRQQVPAASGSLTDAVDGTSSGDDDAAGLMERIEEKGHMISQLGSFLSQMKQESEGTATAWKEKLQETAELKRQLTSVSQQLASAQDKERETLSQLEHVAQELDEAIHALKEREQTHIEELTMMNDEIKKQQSEAEHVKAGYEQSLKEISQELLETQQKLQETMSRNHLLEEALQKMEEGHRLALSQYDEEQDGMRKDLEELGKHLEVLDREKHELGQHLWNVSQELQHTKQREEDLERKCAGATKDLEQSQIVWSERFHHFQSERAEQLGVHSMLQTQLQELEAKFQTERSQKEELNALMVQEMQRFHHEMESVHQSHQEAMEREIDEKEQWKSQALEHQENLVRSQQIYVETNTALEDLQGRLQQIDEENQHLQQNGTEKASALQ